MFFQAHTPRRESPWVHLGRFVALAILFIAISPTARAEPAVSREYQLKAAFLYNFTKFIEWPATQFPHPDSPVVIGVVGRNPFGKELDLALKDRQAHGRPIVARHFATLSEVEPVHLLFFAVGEERGATRDTLAALHQAGVVTVGESFRFADLGGTITFTTDAGKLRFEIDRSATTEGGVKLSAQLLKLAAPRRTP